MEMQNTTLFHLSEDRPVISCFDAIASVGDRNVALRCEVRARPPLSALFWLIDSNGTTVTEGKVINEFWTFVMVKAACS